MTTTPQSTVLPARRAADSGTNGYLERVTAAEDHRRAAKSALTKIARGKRTQAEGGEEFAAAITGMSESGVTIAQIARETNLSETHIRNTIKIWTLEHRNTGSEQAG